MSIFACQITRVEQLKNLHCTRFLKIVRIHGCMQCRGSVPESLLLMFFIFFKKTSGTSCPFCHCPFPLCTTSRNVNPSPPPCPTQGKMSQKIFNTWYAPESIGMVFIGHLLNKNVKHSWVPHRRNWGTSAPCRTVIDHRCTIVHLWSTTGTLWRSTEHKFSRKKCN